MNPRRNPIDHPPRNIGVKLTASEFDPNELEGKTVVIIDVLRATSVIVTALAHGATRIIPIADIEDARSMAGPGRLLCGERNAIKPNDFDLGNSPLEYLPERVKDMEILLTTTNGTLATSRALRASKILAGSFLNLEATVGELLNDPHDIELICAGTHGQFSLDDFLCAGGLIAPLIKSGKWETDDLGQLAASTWELNCDHLTEALVNCNHYQVLKEKGFYHDLSHCLSLNLYNLPIILSFATNIHSFIKIK